MKVQEEAKKPYSAGGIFSKKSGGLLGLVLASLCPKGWASSVQVFIDRVDLYAPGGGETRCSAVWSAHLFWVQRAIGSNPVTLMWRIQKKMNAEESKLSVLIQGR